MEKSKKRGLSIKAITLSLLLFFILLPSSVIYGEDTIAISFMSDDETEEMVKVRTYLQRKGYGVNLYKKAKTLEKQIENANRINRSKAGLFLAMDVRIGERERLLVAYGSAKPVTGRLLTIEEIPGKHIESSKRLAGCIASFLGKSSKEIPLFPLLGIDMPGVFLSFETTRERINDIYEKMDGCLKNFFRRDDAS
ncbi:MAG: hypothetical protein N2745_04745 [Syntrophorhabdaceae bacterium]|nr:hypothetical protein [Syntrophorhabdaceae bacterium]